MILVAHSYLATLVHAGPRRVTDFHNLEWQHLADVSAAATGARRAWLRGQAALMRRTEAAVVRQDGLCLFTGAGERAWACGAARDADRLLVVPNRLPSAEVDAANRVARARQEEPAGSGLMYVGTLRFPPNAAALSGFLATVWPRLRDRWPDLRLQVAGGVGAPDPPPELMAEGVSHHGFVRDLDELLSRATAVIFPFSGAAGSSLRALHLALSAVPVVGNPEAFRGHGEGLGQPARGADEWIAAIARARDAPFAGSARERALALQHDETVWDALYEQLVEIGAAAQA